MNSKLNECHPRVSLWRTIGPMRLLRVLVAFSAIMFFFACTDYQAEFDDAFGAMEYAGSSDDQILESSSSKGAGKPSEKSSSSKTEATSSSVEGVALSSEMMLASSSSGEEIFCSSSQNIESSDSEGPSSSEESSNSNSCNELEADCYKDDRDGKTYRTAYINGLRWMTENLNYKVDGSHLPDTSEYGLEYARSYKNYTGEYGRYYTWSGAMVACPTGWRLPSISEYKELIEFAGGKYKAANNLKSKSGWAERIANGEDKFNFSALPAGYMQSGNGFYNQYTRFVGFWSSDGGSESSEEAELMYISDSALTQNSLKETYAYSVRCVKGVKPSSSGSATSSSSESSSSQSSSSEKKEKCYGKEYSPLTHFCDDRDGTIYRYFTTELIIWMAENLKYETQESYCPKDSLEYCSKYGRLYTWEAAKVACPSGWHLASSNEYGQLRYDVGNVANRLMSESWNGQDGIGFDALPAGYRYSSGSGYNYVGSRAYFWTSTSETAASASYVNIEYSQNKGGYVFNSVPEGDRKEAYSVRCAKLR